MEMTDLVAPLEWDVAPSAETLVTIRSGLEPLRQAKQASRDDIAVADDLRGQAQALTDDLQTLKGLIDGFTASQTYNPLQMNQMRNMLSQVVAAQIKVTQALTEGYAHRKTDDQTAVVANRSIEYLSVHFFGEG